MPFYALATIPVINIQAEIPDIKKIWYVDDSNAAGTTQMQQAPSKASIRGRILLYVISVTCYISTLSEFAITHL